MKNLEKRILAGGLSLIIGSTSLSACNTAIAIDKTPIITSGPLLEEDMEIKSSPTPSLEASPTPSLEASPTPSLEASPTPSLEASPTPERLIKPSIIVSRGNQSKAEIAFTFDDSGVGLHKILDICNKKGIKSTFFLIAGELKSNPEIWKQAVKDGHQVCNHTVGHRMDLPNLSKEEIKKEILGWEKVAKEVLGEEYLEKMKKDFPYFRSPGGNRSDRLQQVLGELGYPITAYWTREDCWFKTNNPNNYTIVENYVLNAQNGDIFLAHGGTFGSIEQIINETEARGYTFKLLSEILD